MTPTLRSSFGDRPYTAIHPFFLLFVALFLAFSLGIGAEPFTFVHLCDTQLGMGGYEHDKETFRLAVEHINKLKPDFTVICGDLIDDVTDDTAYDDFNAIKAGFTAPVYCAPGNHDLGNEPTREYLERFRKVIGPDRMAFDHNGYLFVVTNTSLWKSPMEGETEEQDAWFEKTIVEGATKGQRAFVFGHYPPFTKKAKEKENYFNLPEAARKDILRLMVKNNAVGFLAGHVHRNQISEYKGMFFVASASTAKNFDGSPMGFRLWTVGERDDITHEFIAVEGAKPPGK